MSEDNKIALFRNFLEIPISQKFAVGGLALTVFSLGFLAHNLLSEFKLDKAEFEVSKLEENNGDLKIENARLKSLSNVGSDEIVITRKVLEELKSRPEFCSTSESTQKPEYTSSANTDLCPPAKVTASPSEINKVCVKESDPSEISDQFEKFNARQNERVFNDHYKNNWVCSPGWIFDLYSLPKKNLDGYWEIEGIFSKDRNYTVINARLQFGASVAGLKKGDPVSITGRITSASDSGVRLSDAAIINKK